MTPSKTVRKYQTTWRVFSTIYRGIKTASALTTFQKERPFENIQTRKKNHQFEYFHALFQIKAIQMECWVLFEMYTPKLHVWWGIEFGKKGYQSWDTFSLLTGALMILVRRLTAI
jgi:hypothetical protein